MPDTPPTERALDLDWQAVTDVVMGGISQATLTRESVDGRLAWRLQGDVRLENNGGFVQMRAPLTAPGPTRGLSFELYGNDETYVISVRTADVRRPWQSYRAEVRVPAAWTRVEATWDQFLPHRIDADLDVAALRSVHLLGVGRAFRADVAVSRVGWLT